MSGSATHCQLHDEIGYWIIICECYISRCLFAQVRDEHGNIMYDADGKPIKKKVGTIKKGKNRVRVFFLTGQIST